jgi:hypothetical protein
MFLTINNKEIESRELDGGYYLQIDDLETKQYLVDILDLNKVTLEYKITIPYRSNDCKYFGYYHGCFYIGNSRIHYDQKSNLSKFHQSS